MSLLSDFGSLGFIAGVDCGLQYLRPIAISSPSINSNSGQYLGVECKDDISFTVQYAEPRPDNATGWVGIFKNEFSNKKSYYIPGPSRAGDTTLGKLILGNPITGGWIIDNPGIQGGGVSQIYQTADNGSTYSTIPGATTTLKTAVYDTYKTGGWFDGTTFAFLGVNNTMYYTTNGTTWSTASTGGQSPPWPKNCRSAFSGYWFVHITSPSEGYTYRTSVNGTVTQVLGYRITSMSSNGRYVTRSNISTRSEEYSTDGGASWTTFPTQSFAGTFTGSGSVGYQVAKRATSDTGQFFIKTYHNLIFIYDSSASQWVATASLPYQAFDNFMNNIKINGVECLMFSNSAPSTGEVTTFLVDMPKGLV